jgi:hypothetical protein
MIGINRDTNFRSISLFNHKVREGKARRARSWEHG